MIARTEFPHRLADPNTPEWLELRKTGIGASECAAALGLDESLTPRQLFHKKRGELPDDDDPDNDFFWIGHQLEPVALRMLGRTTGIECTKPSPGLFRHREVPSVLATPDGICSDGWLAEAKAVSTFSPNNPYRSDEFGADESDEIPVKWLLQCQQQLAVMGAPGVHVCVLIGGMEFRHFRVERNEVLINKTVRGIDAFWQRVINNDPPEWEPDEKSLALIRDLYRTVDDRRTIILSPEAAQAVDRERELKAEIKALEKERDACKSVYLAEIEDARAGVLPDGSGMVKRSIVQRKGYTVEPGEYVTSRLVKVDRPAIEELSKGGA